MVRIDDLVTGTVNASTSESVTAERIAQNALQAFFFEVPLNSQVAFLEQHCLDEDRALRFAMKIDTFGRSVPLEPRSRW